MFQLLIFIFGDKVHPTNYILLLLAGLAIAYYLDNRKIDKIIVRKQNCRANCKQKVQDKIDRIRRGEIIHPDEHAYGIAAVVGGYSIENMFSQELAQCEYKCV